MIISNLPINTVATALKGPPPLPTANRQRFWNQKLFGQKLKREIWSKM
jgi:ribosomal protein S10